MKLERWSLLKLEKFCISFLIFVMNLMICISIIHCRSSRDWLLLLPTHPLARCLHLKRCRTSSAISWSVQFCKKSKQKNSQSKKLTFSFSLVFYILQFTFVELSRFYPFPLVTGLPAYKIRTLYRFKQFWIGVIDLRKT